MTSTDVLMYWALAAFLFVTQMIGVALGKRELAKKRQQTDQSAT